MKVKTEDAVDAAALLVELFGTENLNEAEKMLKKLEAKTAKLEKLIEKAEKGKNKAEKTSRGKAR